MARSLLFESARAQDTGPPACPVGVVRTDCTGAAATCAWCAERLPGEGPARTNHRTPQPGAEHGRVPVSPAGVVCACVEYPPVVCVGARGAGVCAVYYVCVRGVYARVYVAHACAVCIVYVCVVCNVCACVWCVWACVVCIVCVCGVHCVCMCGVYCVCGVCMCVLCCVCGVSVHVCGACMCGV